MTKYPLQQLAEIKKKRLEEAEKVLAEKKAILAKEQEKLAALEKARDEVKDHKDAKLAQLREVLDTAPKTEKIQQMKQYLKLVQEKLKVEEKKVADQKKVIEAAEQQVEIARQDLFQKHKDVEKLKMHREEWGKEVQKEVERQEGIETDEMGNAMHLSKKRGKKRHD